MKPRIVLVAGAALVSLAYLPACRTASPNPAVTDSAKKFPAVAAYVERMEDQLGPIWYQLTKIHADELSIGTVDMTFEIPAAGGKVRNLKLASNSGNTADVLIAFRAIYQLRLPPIPRQVLAELHHDYIEVEESFTVFPSE